MPNVEIWWYYQTCRNTSAFVFSGARGIYCFYEYLLWIMGKRFVNKWPGWMTWLKCSFLFDYLGFMHFSSSTLACTTVNNEELYENNVVIIEICSPQKYVKCRTAELTSLVQVPNPQNWKNWERPLFGLRLVTTIAWATTQPSALVGRC